MLYLLDLLVIKMKRELTIIHLKEETGCSEEEEPEEKVEGEEWMYDKDINTGLY